MSGPISKTPPLCDGPGKKGKSNKNVGLTNFPSMKSYLYSLFPRIFPLSTSSVSVKNKNTFISLLDYSRLELPH